MRFNLPDHLSLAEGEVVVRSYHCTCLSPIFKIIGLRTNGYLAVTNKRVVYFAAGSSLWSGAGSSQFHRETPVEDVSGFGFCKGTRFSFLRICFAILFGALVTVGLTIAGGAIAWLLLSVAQKCGVGETILPRFALLVGLAVSAVLFVWSLSFSRDNIFRSSLTVSCIGLPYAICTFVLLAAGGNPLLLIGHISTITVTLIIYTFIMSCYWLATLFWFSRRLYVTMDILSKGTGYAPISITAISWGGLYNIAAGMASCMAPAGDAEVMVKELGAMITDLQVMGDHAIEKWKLVEKVPDTKMVIARNEATARSRRLALRFAAAAIILVGMCLAVETGIDAYNLRKQRIAAQIKEAQKEQERYALILKKESEVAASKGLITSGDSLKLISLLDKYSGDEWKNVRADLNEANLHWEKGDDWTAWHNACSSATNRFPRAVRQMYAGILVEKAEAEVQKDNAPGILSFAQKALEECPGYASAEELVRLANAITGYNRCLTTEVRRGRLTAGTEDSLIEQMDVYGEDKWTKVKEIVIRAKSLRSQKTRSACVLAWLEAGNLLRVVLLERWEAALPLAAKSENWQAVSALSEDILSVNPKHEQAKAMLNLVNLINQAEKAKAEYNRSFASALERAAKEGYVNWDDEAAFVQQLDLYGGENWGKVKGCVESANKFANNARMSVDDKKGTEALAQWKFAVANLSDAAATTRAGFWLQKTDNEIKNNNWPKVLAYAVKALDEQPGNTRAAQVKYMAECKGQLEVLQSRYEKDLKQVLEKEVEAGRLKAGDQSGLCTQLDQFGGEAWKSVKENTDKAKSFEAQKKYVESFVAWTAANQKIASAIRCMRAELILQTAEAEKQKGNWAKVYASAEKALTEDPGNGHAIKLKNEANEHSK